MSKQGRLPSQGQPASTERRLAQARELLAWYGSGTVQHIHATRELERLAARASSGDSSVEEK